MAKRYRYAFAKKKESGKGKLSVGLSIASLVLFPAAIFLSLFLPEKYGFVTGCVCLLAALLSAYGFLVGLSETQYEHGRRHCQRDDPGGMAQYVPDGWMRMDCTGPEEESDIGRDHYGAI